MKLSDTCQSRCMCAILPVTLPVSVTVRQMKHRRTQVMFTCDDFSCKAVVGHFFSVSYTSCKTDEMMLCVCVCVILLTLLGMTALVAGVWCHFTMPALMGTMKSRNS